MTGHQVELPQRGLEFTQQALQSSPHTPVPGQVESLQERRAAESVACATNAKVNRFTQQHTLPTGFISSDQTFCPKTLFHIMTITFWRICQSCCSVCILRFKIQTQTTTHREQCCSCTASALWSRLHTAGERSALAGIRQSAHSRRRPAPPAEGGTAAASLGGGEVMMSSVVAVRSSASTVNISAGLISCSSKY